MSLPPSVKNKNILQSLSDYLERRRNSIACYILRREMGLRISSNPVEKANDMLVSRRQKGKGMSWSRNGSWGLAGITAKYLNNESRNWNENHSMSFKMYRVYLDIVGFLKNWYNPPYGQFNMRGCYEHKEVR